MSPLVLVGTCVPTMPLQSEVTNADSDGKQHPAPAGQDGRMPMVLLSFRGVGRGEHCRVAASGGHAHQAPAAVEGGEDDRIVSTPARAARHALRGMHGDDPAAASRHLLEAAAKTPTRVPIVKVIATRAGQDRTSLSASSQCESTVPAYPLFSGGVGVAITSELQPSVMLFLSRASPE